MKNIYPASFIKKYLTPSLNPLLLPTSDDIIKRETAEYGIGVYTLHSYQRGDCIGHFLAMPSNTLRQHSLQRAIGDHLEDPYFVGYLLHSCDPNVVLDMHQQKAFCLKDIQAGGPLFIDYASTEDVLFRQFACACSAPNCRHWITGRNEPVNAEGRMYLDEKENQLLLINTAIYETRLVGSIAKKSI
ncbi:hypothetical protein [Parvularcula sp. IMCC14364]|uniref:hypothetical protein n=1 Tax=Parvularcula sp. IMCC14364 TaxID=3067902 RepID=UPI002740EF6E|nr:hypothetical protein [Parvularcula sp. IMCC14364]